MSVVELVQLSPAGFAVAIAVGSAFAFVFLKVVDLLSHDEKARLRRSLNTAVAEIQEARSNAESSEQDEESKTPDRGWNTGSK